MQKFVVTIRGVNFLIRENDATAAALQGFYVNAYVEAATFEEAELNAVALVRASPKLRPRVANAQNDPPRLWASDTRKLSDWPQGQSLPLSGFIFYPDPDSDWRKEPPVS